MGKIEKLPIPQRRNVTDIRRARTKRGVAELASSNVALLAYDSGRTQIIAAVSVDEVRTIRDKAEALRRYWKQRRDVEMEAAMSALRLRADYEIGVRSRAMETAEGPGPGRGKKGSGDRKPFGKLAILQAAGIPFQRAAENEKLGEILTPKDVDQLCRAAVRECLVVKSSTAFLLQWKDDQIKAAFQSIKSDLPPNVFYGDFRELSPKEISAGSVDLVFTDPPYDRESIPLYEAAAEEAKRILKPGGSMICYCGHLILPDVLPKMMEHLKYYWIGAHVHDGGPMSRMTHYGIVAGFKPLLWLVKDHRADRQSFVCDTVLVDREKGSHPWQQAIAVAEHFIKALTVDGGMVVDFFAGGGTTYIAAQRLNRTGIAFDRDEKAIVAIHQRVAAL